jgi:hypothetical protein
MGLAWTALGGSTLYVEAASVERGEGKGSLKATGGRAGRGAVAASRLRQLCRRHAAPHYIQQAPRAAPAAWMPIALVPPFPTPHPLLARRPAWGRDEGERHHCPHLRPPFPGTPAPRPSHLLRRARPAPACARG